MLKPWTFEKICGMLKAHRPKTHGGMTMLHLHNSTRIAVLGAAVVVLLIGAGCKPGASSDAALSGSAQDRGGDPAELTQDATASGTAEFDAASDAPSESNDVSELTWTTHDSPALGLSIPYPEGWYVEEETKNEASVLRFHNAPAPTVATEYPAQMWSDARPGTVADFLSQFDPRDILERTEVERSKRTMTRVVLDHDEYDRAVSYLWEERGKTLRIAGAEGSPEVEYAVDHLEVLP
jgi:hypothetical protein